MIRINLFLPVILIAACGPLGSHSACPARAAGINVGHCEEIGNMIVPPRNVLDVLANLKSALDSDEMLKREFYTEQNIEAISGGHDVQWTVKTSTEQFVWVADFSTLIAPVTIAGWPHSGIDYSIGAGVRPSGQR